MWSDLWVHKIPVAAGVEDGLKGRDRWQEGRLGGGCHNGPPARWSGPNRGPIPCHHGGGGAPACPWLVPPPGAQGSCRGPEWASALMLQAENRMRAAKRHRGCLSGGETPQHGFMVERLLGKGEGNQLSPILTKGK